MATKSWRYTDVLGLYSYLDDYRIDTALVYNAVADRDPENGNTDMLKIAAESNGRIKPCMLLEPSLDSLGLPGEGTPLDRLRASKPSAVRVRQGENSNFVMDKFYAKDMLVVLNEIHMPLLIEGEYSHQFLHALPEMALVYPNVPMILLHWGLNASRIIYPLLKHTSNVYFDMSVMIDAGAIEEIVEKFGSERLMFGSALPHFVPAGALALIKYPFISDKDKENIAHANFERLEGGIRL